MVESPASCEMPSLPLPTTVECQSVSVAAAFTRRIPSCVLPEITQFTISADPLLMRTPFFPLESMVQRETVTEV